MKITVIEYDWFDSINRLVYKIEYYYDTEDEDIKHIIHLDPDNPLREMHIDPSCFLPTYRRSLPQSKDNSK